MISCGPLFGLRTYRKGERFESLTTVGVGHGDGVGDRGVYDNKYALIRRSSRAPRIRVRPHPVCHYRAQLHLLALAGTAWSCNVHSKQVGLNRDDVRFHRSADGIECAPTHLDPVVARPCDGQGRTIEKPALRAI